MTVFASRKNIIYRFNASPFRGGKVRSTKFEETIMIFSSIPFLYYFLPAVLAVYYLTPRRGKNAVLLLASLFFYGWGEPVYIGIMGLSILIDYTHGLLVEKYRSRDTLARWFVADSMILHPSVGQKRR